MCGIPLPWDCSSRSTCHFSLYRFSSWERMEKKKKAQVWILRQKKMCTSTAQHVCVSKVRSITHMLRVTHYKYRRRKEHMCYVQRYTERKRRRGPNGPILTWWTVAWLCWKYAMYTRHLCRWPPFGSRYCTSNGNPANNRQTGLLCFQISFYMRRQREMHRPYS